MSVMPLKLTQCSAYSEFAEIKTSVSFADSIGTANALPLADETINKSELRYDKWGHCLQLPASLLAEENTIRQ